MPIRHPEPAQESGELMETMPAEDPAGPRQVCIWLELLSPSGDGEELALWRDPVQTRLEQAGSRSPRPWTPRMLTVAAAPTTAPEDVLEFTHVSLTHHVDGAVCVTRTGVTEITKVCGLASELGVPTLLVTPGGQPVLLPRLAGKGPFAHRAAHGPDEALASVFDWASAETDALLDGPARRRRAAGEQAARSAAPIPFFTDRQDGALKQAIKDHPEAYTSGRIVEVMGLAAGKLAAERRSLQGGLWYRATFSAQIDDSAGWNWLLTQLPRPWTTEKR
jgi:hypothetical protein